MSVAANSLLIKSIASSLGFDYCGIAKAVRLEDDARRLEQWLNNDMHASMHYMEKNFDLRVDPTLLVPGAKSVVTLLINYFPDKQQPAKLPKVAKYAMGKDYHEVVRKKLNSLLEAIREKIGAVQGRGFVDSAPVLERSWAVRSGLGWVGKNGNLINKKSGSFFFIASLIIDLELATDDPFGNDYCGTCTRCIDQCPTDAILPDKVIDGSKCIAYFTIELKEALIPDQMKGKFGDWMFGCDVCQDVCPWNRFSIAHQEPAFEPIPALLAFKQSDWEALTEEKFKTVFQHSPLKRAKYAGIRRNLQFIQNTDEKQH
jgi:epoxyqueuosine reductase